jgi:hypothetical protein
MNIFDISFDNLINGFPNVRAKIIPIKRAYTGDMKNDATPINTNRYFIQFLLFIVLIV